MSLYSNTRPSRGRRFFQYTGRFFAVIFILVGAIALLYFLFKHFTSSLNNKNLTTKPVSTTIVNDTQTFKTDYFQFTSARSWKFLKENSTDKKYVYANFRESIAEEQFEVYLDAPPIEHSTSYAAAVDVANNNQLVLSSFSNHCKEYIPDKTNKNQQLVKYQDAEFLCRPDSQVADVVVAQHGGTIALNLQRKDGSKKNYYLYFRDSRFTPQIDNMVSLISSFTAL